MAIKWFDKDRNLVDMNYHGMVISKISQTNRGEGDSFVEETYAVVWDPEAAIERRVMVDSQSSLFSGPKGEVEVDLLKLYQAQREQIKKAAAERAIAQEKERLEQARVKAILEEHHRPVNGKVMEVTRGRKVPLGTKGQVFWVDNAKNPTRVGMATSDRVDRSGKFLDVAWVDAAYVENVEPFDSNKTPARPQKPKPLSCDQILQTLGQVIHNSRTKLLTDKKLEMHNDGSATLTAKNGEKFILAVFKR